MRIYPPYSPYTFSPHYALMKRKPSPALSLAALFTSDPSPASVTYLPLLAALIVYTPAAAPLFCRTTKRSHEEAVPRAAASVPVPDWSAVTYCLELTSCSVPALGRYAEAKVDAAPASVPDATRLGLPLEGTLTYLDDEADWILNVP